MGDVEDFKMRLKEKERKIPNNPFHLDNLPLENQMFKAERNGKIIYILPTMHNVCASRLSDACLQIITNEAKILIRETHTEEVNDDTESNTTAGEPQEQKKQKSDWLSKLSDEEKEILTTALGTIYPNDDINLYKEIGVEDFCEYFYSILFYPHGMDYTIRSIFKDDGKKVYGLDIPENNTALLNEELNEVYTIEALKKIIAALSKKTDGHTILPLKVQKELDDYRPYALGILEEEDHLSLQVGNVIERNLKWIDKIINLHEYNEDKILLMCGANHLTSEQGVLQLLYNNDFSIEQMDHNGTFKPYAPFLVPTLLLLYREVLTGLDKFRTDSLDKLNQQNEQLFKIQEKVNSKKLKK